MTKLNQLIAVEQTVKATAKREETELYRIVQKGALLSGIQRTYQPKDDEGDKLPAESTHVQVNAEVVLKELGTTLTRLFDVTFTKETANASAAADVVVDGDIIVPNAPVTYLLFLEKQLVDVATFVRNLPTLDPSQLWHKDANTGVFATEPVQTVKTKKVPRNWVKAEATDRHPAQVEVFNEDVIVGTWTKIDLSGAVPATRKAELVRRVEKLQTAVKFAREEANNAEVTDRKAADSVFSYLFS